MMKGKKTQKTIRSYAPHLAAAAFVMVLVTVLALFAPAYAATSGSVSGLSDETIGLSYSGTASDPWTVISKGTAITGSAMGTPASDCGSDTHYNSTLTITNNRSTPAILSFDYVIEQNNGTIQVDGNSVSSNSSFSKKLGAEKFITIYIKSGSTSAATKITLNNVKLVADTGEVQTTFELSENGSYKVDGAPITEAVTKSKSSTVGYTVVATPDKGYKFLGWYNVDEEKYISTAATATLNIEEACTITAKFTAEETAVFETSGQVFTDLNEADTCAKKNSNKITLISDGTLAAGNYTISSGNTLLIPFDAAGTLYTATPTAVRTNTAPSPFRTLTLASDANITVNGAISVGGQYYAAGGGQKGQMTGPYGWIKLEQGSGITVKSGGKLYAWGFVSGEGSVTVDPYGTVYEWFQLMDFRGGAETALKMVGKGVFVISQYAVQNIEAPLTIKKDANEITYAAIYVEGISYTEIPFIGSNGMFKINSGSLTKKYIREADRVEYAVNGTAELNNMSITISVKVIVSTKSYTIDSKDYDLPLTNNMTVTLKSGSKLTVNQDTALLPGVQINIDQKAELCVPSGYSMYVYDKAQWEGKGYCGAGKNDFIAVPYVTDNESRHPRTSADLLDAEVKVNGTLTAAGAIYTTADGAKIWSEGTGKFVQQGAVGTATKTYQHVQGEDGNRDIPITPARLLNKDGSYTETAGKSAGTTIEYAKELGKWGGQPATVVFDGQEGTPNDSALLRQLVDLSDTSATITCPTFTKNQHEFLGFAVKADATKVDFAVNESGALSIAVSALKEKTKAAAGDTITLYAVYKQSYLHTVDWIVTGVDGVEIEQTKIMTEDETVTKSVADLKLTGKYIIKSCEISPKSGANQTVTLPADNIKLTEITSNITVTLELVAYDHIVTIKAGDSSETHYVKGDEDVLTNAAITYTAGAKQVITNVTGHTAKLTRGEDDVNDKVTDGWKSFTLSGINADQTVAVTLKDYAHTVDWTRKEDDKGSAITTTRREYVVANEDATLKLSKGFRATDVTGADSAAVTSIGTGVVTISGIAKDLTVTVTARNYSYAVTWNVNSTQEKTDYLDFDKTAATYTAGENTVITDASVSSDTAAQVTHTNTKVTVTDISSDVTVHVTTAAPTTDKATYYFGDMSYEYKRNTVLYQWDGKSEDKGRWIPVDSFAWQHKAGSRIYEFEGSPERYVVPNGSVLLVNGSNQTMQYTVTYAPDGELTNAVMTFTAGEETGSNTLSVVLKPGKQAMVSSTFACDVKDQKLTNAAAGQVTVTTAVYDG